jgi:hypothetical protein
MTLKAFLRDHQVYATRRDSPQRRLLHALWIGRKGAGRFADAFPLALAETAPSDLRNPPAFCGYGVVIPHFIEMSLEFRSHWKVRSVFRALQRKMQGYAKYHDKLKGRRKEPIVRAKRRASMWS